MEKTFTLDEKFSLREIQILKKICKKIISQEDEELNKDKREAIAFPVKVTVIAETTIDPTGLTYGSPVPFSLDRFGGMKYGKGESFRLTRDEYNKIMSIPADTLGKLIRRNIAKVEE